MSSTPDKSGLGSFPFARRYLGNRTFFLFLRVLRCFSSPGVPSYTYFIECMILEGCSSRFPHSEISGSQSICDSPKHIGAYPILHRLLVPRHSPYALNNLTYLFYIYILLFVVFNVHAYFMRILSFAHVVRFTVRFVSNSLCLLDKKTMYSLNISSI